MSLLWRCAICIAAIYWFSPVHDRVDEPRHASPAVTRSGPVVTGSVGKAGQGASQSQSGTNNGHDLITAAEQAARLLNSLDAATRRRLIEALISTQDGGEAGTRPK
ncbi:MAG: hypothetical protein KF735_07005 [Chelatococcus sp.]|uniref:hypothetical protein n=1 Tax=unclassified Chelatococcus TaxID=2638111 RepID=UPI001BCE45D9|nr:MULTISPECIES: hypothetical protein [unclassified Chelatococcus]CAH1669366.1 conserved hypothetical protein [Hyphomicrobiales bacterium]MBS7739344.1 hypothetical protein [Chelatococcus sp. HY11]MBX3537365.1 hypothetical protein [Chelatococcus sp.]MBX3546623.1 hypothetical protein [Chelatococcus sp.]MCO5076121.1 hypothetical protein [Chelatococcus sp.]